MKKTNKFNKIYIYKQHVDFRRGIYSLVGLIQDDMEINPFLNYLFIFTNSSRNRIRLLYWDKTGFAMWYKILEKGNYSWPLKLKGDAITIDDKILQSLLKGLNPWQQGHEELFYKKV